MSQANTHHEARPVQEPAGPLPPSRETVDSGADVAESRGLPSAPGPGADQSAVRDWLRRCNGRDAFLAQAGALRDDESLEELLEGIYAARGRPEVEE